MRCALGLVVALALLILASISTADIQRLTDEELSQVRGAINWKTCNRNLSCPRTCFPTPPPDQNPGGVDPLDYPSCKVDGRPAKACMSFWFWNCTDNLPSVRCGQWYFYQLPDCNGFGWGGETGYYSFAGPACAGVPGP